MLGIGIALGIAGLNYVYHRYIDPPEPPKPPPPAKSLSIPTTEAGTPYGLVYGRRRTTPVLAYVSPAQVIAGSGAGAPDAPWVYGADMLLILGIPFEGSPDEIRIREMYAGELRLSQAPPGLLALRGNGSFETPVIVGTSGGLAGGTGPIYGVVELLNGRSTQDLVDAFGAATTKAGERMLSDGVAANAIAGYRNFVCAFLSNAGSSDRWWVGSQAQINTYDFEMQTLPTTFIGPNRELTVYEGDLRYGQGDCNPIDALYDLCTGTRGKLGMSPGSIHIASWRDAAATLDAEGNGFSIAWNRGTRVSEMVDTIMRQIDGVPYWDPRDGQLHLKLVRPDFDPTKVLAIHPGNCEKIDSIAISGATDAPNKVRVKFYDRRDAYRQNTATAMNLANAIGQNGEVRATDLDMAGVCTLSNAAAIAARELAAMSGPIFKCKAYVDRRFRNVMPGDVVRLDWRKPAISGAMMRVAAVNRGTPDDNRITLSLIRDYFYTWRGRSPLPPGTRANVTAVGAL